MDSPNFAAPQLVVTPNFFQFGWIATFSVFDDFPVLQHLGDSATSCTSLELKMIIKF